FVFALAFLGAVHANPLATSKTLTPLVHDVNAGHGFPVVDLDLGSVAAHGNVTVGKGGVHADSADSTYPAYIYICPVYNCASCYVYDLSEIPHEECLAFTFDFHSIAISQPSSEGLPFAVYSGPAGCGAFAQVPLVNTCYNTNGYVGRDVELTP
ncbi:hypothetical protein K466DRAFT_521547, partial [Polyporus arcularius HHB13444]